MSETFVRGPGSVAFLALADQLGLAGAVRDGRPSGLLLVDCSRGVGPDTVCDARALKALVDRIVVVLHGADQVAISSLELTSDRLDELVLRHGFRSVPVLVLPALVPSEAASNGAADLLPRGVVAALRVLAA